LISIEEYIKKCCGGKLPIALKMNFTDSMSMYYWLYWRFYDTCIPKNHLFDLFGAENKKLNYLLWFLNVMKMVEESENQITLNKRGAFWLHLAQNYFSLNYINKIWSIARENPYPNRINI